MNHKMYEKGCHAHIADLSKVWLTGTKNNNRQPQLQLIHSKPCLQSITPLEAAGISKGSFDSIQHHTKLAVAP